MVHNLLIPMPFFAISSSVSHQSTRAYGTPKNRLCPVLRLLAIYLTFSFVQSLLGTTKSGVTMVLRYFSSFAFKDSTMSGCCAAISLCSAGSISKSNSHNVLIVFSKSLREKAFPFYLGLSSIAKFHIAEGPPVSNKS